MKSVVANAVSGLLALVLCACDSPSPAFRGLPATEVRVDGTRFAVRHTGVAAEAIRLSPGRPPARSVVVRKGARAILAVSGCVIRPASLKGDAAIVTAELTCAGAGPAPPPVPRPIELDCRWDREPEAALPERRDFGCVVLR